MFYKPKVLLQFQHWKHIPRGKQSSKIRLIAEVILTVSFQVVLGEETL